MATVKEELGKLFERLNDFTLLGEEYDLIGDIARVPKLQLAKQISETFVSKDSKKEQVLFNWLKEHVTESYLVEAKEATKIKDWDDFVYFKRKYQNLLKTIIRELGSFNRQQKWIDIKKIINSLNKLNLEATWGKGKVASATVAALSGKIAMNPTLIAALKVVVAERDLSNVYHVSDLSVPRKKPNWSLEGAGLSVSQDPAKTQKLGRDSSTERS